MNLALMYTHTNTAGRDIVLYKGFTFSSITMAALHIHLSRRCLAGIKVTY